MSIEQLILLAIIQGITEFLPISSSAHLILLPQLMDLPDQGPLIDVAVHVGSLGAVLLYFRGDVAALFRGIAHLAQGHQSSETKLLINLIIATPPVLFMGLALYVSGMINELRSAEVIAWMTIMFGVILYLADRWGKEKKTLEKLKMNHALAIGVAQCVSLIPGTSRSGITMTMARSLGYTRTESARFSMLLALPTIAAFGLYTAFEIYESGSSILQQDALFVMVLSFASAYAAIAFFMRLLQRMSLLPFVIYRLVLGFALLGYIYL